MVQFSEMVTHQIGHYVYALARPRQFSEGRSELRDRIFYIGKGQGNRCFNHANLARDRGEAALREGEHKLAMIREIHSNGADVEIHIIAHGLEAEAAFDLEAVLIPLLGSTNIVEGHGGRKLWLTTTEIVERHDNPIQRRDTPLLCENLLIVSLNKQKISQLMLDDEKLSEATLGNWVLAENKSAKVDILVGVKNSLIVSIFDVEKTPERLAKYHRTPPPKKRMLGRSRFFGTRNHELEQDLLGRSIYDGERCISKVRPQAGCEFYPKI